MNKVDEIVWNVKGQMELLPHDTCGPHKAGNLKVCLRAGCGGRPFEF